MAGGDTVHHHSPRHSTTKIHLKNASDFTSIYNNISLWLRKDSNGYQVSCMKWTMYDMFGLFKYHPLLCLLGVMVLFFMGVEYTLSMIPSSSPPFDIGFVVTIHLHRVLADCPAFNTVLAGLNTVFVGMQAAYIIGTWVVEGRPRATIATLVMFTFRGILGYSTQLPLPQGFLGSGVDFPVGNVSFFLFYSGHVAASVIASLDMRRMHRLKFAFLFDMFNILQIVRLLSTPGHYTIDLVVGVGAAVLSDSLAEAYIYRTFKTLPNGLDVNSNSPCKSVIMPKTGTQ